MSDVPDPVTKTAITTSWGKSVADDIDELFANKLERDDITPIAVKTTEPTAADYGLPSIPIGAVWIQSPEA
jgi:predicted component of type VI protein secretion system